MKKLAIISTLVLGLATTSCDSYLDINQDPNSPAEYAARVSVHMSILPCSSFFLS